VRSRLPARCDSQAPGGDHHGVGPQRFCGVEVHPGALPVPVHTDHGGGVDRRAARGHCMGKCMGEPPRVDEALTLDADPHRHVGGGQRNTLAQSISLEAAMGQNLSEPAQALQFVDQMRGVVFGAEQCGDRHVGGRRIDPIRGQHVERLEALLVEGKVGGDGPVPRGPAAVGRETGEERPQVHVGAGRNVQRCSAVRQRLQSVGQDGRLVQRDGECRRDPACVAPRRTGGDATPVHHRHVHAALLQEPRGGQADDAGPHHDDRARTSVEHMVVDHYATS
jgi:hypothetical protein